MFSHTKFEIWKNIFHITFIKLVWINPLSSSLICDKHLSSVRPDLRQKVAWWALWFLDVELAWNWRTGRKEELAIWKIE